MHQSTVHTEGKFAIYELIHGKANSSLQVVPARGGIVIGLKLLGNELLFLNEETLLNEQANIRGGIPILFPICGQLVNGEYTLNDQVYRMKNHGVARNHPWEVLGTKEDEELSITLRLTSNEETKRSFPFDFELIFRYELQENALIIHQEYRNDSQTAMPMYSGFHPYFLTSDKTISMTTDAKTYFDYNDMTVKNFEGTLDLQNKPESVVLLDADTPEVRFHLPEINRTVRLGYDPIFRYMVVWTEQGAPFMCVEPWMAKPNELNLKNELIYVQPGESLQTRITISIDDESMPD